mgnify:CR=1 FL=1
MKSKSKLITYGSRIAIIGLTILIISLIASGFDFKELSGFLPNNEEKNKAYSIYDVKTININLTQTDINISQSKDSLIRTEFKSLGKKYTSELRNGVLELNIKPENPQLEIDSPDELFNINIPLAYEGKINVRVNQGDIDYKGESLSENIKLFTTNGSININDSKFRKNIEIKNANGLINIEDSACENINIISIIGNLNLNRIDSKNKINIQGNSGTFTLNSLSSDKLKIEVNSGYLEVNNSAIYNDLLINSNKAKVSLKNTNIGNNLLVESTNGQQDYKYIQGKRIDLSSTDGNISGNFLGSNDLYNLSIKTNGKIEAPETTGYQEFNINSNTGDVKISISKEM